MKETSIAGHVWPNTKDDEHPHFDDRCVKCGVKYSSFHLKCPGKRRVHMSLSLNNCTFSESNKDKFVKVIYDDGIVRFQKGWYEKEEHMYSEKTVQITVFKVSELEECITFDGLIEALQWLNEKGDNDGK